MKVKQKYLRYFIITGWHLLPFPYNGPFSPFFINNTLSPSLRICILSAGVAYSTSPPRGPNWGLSSGRWTWVIPGPLLLRAHLSWTPQVMALYLILPPCPFSAKGCLEIPPPPPKKKAIVGYPFTFWKSKVLRVSGTKETGSLEWMKTFRGPFLSHLYLWNVNCHYVC